METITIYGNGNLVSGAQVIVYLDAGLTNRADDISVLGEHDAVAQTDSHGYVQFGLVPGMYYAHIIASGYVSYTTSFVMPADGLCGFHQFYLTTASQTELSLEKTTVTLVPSTIFSDNQQTAVLTIQAFNTVGSVMSNIPVGLTTNDSGLVITAHATSTDPAGRATFSIKAFLPGTDTLFPQVNYHAVKSTTLNVIGSATTGSSSTNAGASVPSATASRLQVSQGYAPPDARTGITVTVTAKDEKGMALSGQRVNPRATLNGVAFSPLVGLTDANGVAQFTMISSSTGLAVITAVIGNVGIMERAEVQFGNTPSSSSSSTMGVLQGRVIKLPNDGNPNTQEDSTVYYVGKDARRHSFPNEKVYFTWYSDYSRVEVVSKESMASFPLGQNVTFRPSVSLLKFPSSPKVYAVAGPHALRWITSAEVAAQLFGSIWATRVLDQSEAFAPAYVFGDDIVNANEYNPTREFSRAVSIDDVLSGS